MMWRRLVIAAVTALVTLIGAFATAQIVPQTPRRVEPLNVAGRSSTVCPTAADSATYVGSGREGGGLTVTGLRPGPPQQVPMDAVTRMEPLDQPLVLTAEGGQTRASGAATYANRSEGPDRGITLGGCVEPASTHWFTGLGATDDLRSEIVLMNPDEDQVSVDVVFHGPEGEIATPGTRGIVVPANQTREVPVESHLTMSDLVSAEVRTQRGRIAATVMDRAGSEVPRGATWAAASRLPANIQVIPAVPDGPGSRRLVITNPGERRATARVEVHGPDGPFVPVGGEQVAVNAGATVTVDLGPGLDGQAGGVRIQADQPITGSVVSTSTDDPMRQDLSVQPATDALNGVGVAAVAVAPGTSSAVLVTNPTETDAVLPMRLVLETGEQSAEHSLVVPAGSTRLWNLPESGEMGAVIAEVPSGSELYAGVMLSAAGSHDALGTAPLTVPEPADEGIEPEAETGLR